MEKGKKEKGRTEKKERKQVGGQEYKIIQKKEKKKNRVKCPPKPNKRYATTVAENSKTQM